VKEAGIAAMTATCDVIGNRTRATLSYTHCLTTHTTHLQVKEAGIAAMTATCDVIGNRDMEHMTADIVRAIVNPAAVPEIMHTLAGVTFVQSVESPALAMTVPLLLRGLR
jgi:hypothetical protein